MTLVSSSLIDRRAGLFGPVLGVLKRGIRTDTISLVLLG